MTRDRLEALAEGLDEAWNGATTVPAPTSIEPGLSLEDAYLIQESIIDRRVQRGRRRAGWKMGLTTADPPTVPIVGTLLDDMIISSGAELSLAAMVAPMVEAEIVVRIGETIERPVGPADLTSGPHEIGPGIEVIDYRTTGSAGPIDWVADNSTVAYAVVADLTPVSDVDPVSIGASLYCDGLLLGAGSGEQVMGNPLAAVAWLAGDRIARGHPLQRGDVVLTGSLTGHHVVPGGKTEMVADFGDLGGVTIRFRP